MAYSTLQTQRIEKFKNILEVDYPLNKEMYMTRYKYFWYFIELVFAVTSQAFGKKSYIMRTLKAMLHSPVYVLSKKRMRTQFKKFVTSGDMELLLDIAKASGSTLSRFCCYFINPRIKFHKKIYIPKNYDRQDMAGLNKCLSDFLMQQSDPRSDCIEKKLMHSASFSYESPKRLQLHTESFRYKRKPNLLWLSKS